MISQSFHLFIKMSRRITWSCRKIGDTENSETNSRNTNKMVLWNYFKEFTANTSLHGLKYLGERKTTKAERIWWVIMFTLSFVTCGYLIGKVWNKWNQTPVIVSFAESSTPVWQIPFPGVTICSETKAKQRNYNFTAAYHLRYANVSKEEKKKMEAISLVCDTHLINTGEKTGDHSNVDFIKEVSPTLEEMMLTCKWKTKQLNCSQIFSPIMTEEGLCYSLNVLDASELFNTDVLHSEYNYLNHGKKSEGWTLDEGYPAGLQMDTYPTRGSGSGQSAGLKILMRAFVQDLDYICRGPVQGFKVILHSPSDVPRASHHYFRVPLSQEVIAAIKPNMMTTSSGLKGYMPNTRQCFFPKERHLKYFKVYTQKNCQLECLSNYTRLLCDCVSFSMPRDPNVPLCASGSKQCMLDAQDQLLTQEIIFGLKDNVKTVEEDVYSGHWDDRKKVAENCNCLPSCTSISYDVETSQADFNWPELFKAYDQKVEEEMPGAIFARLVLLFKESQFITSKRSELYGTTDFLANCGGLLGLFLGFSLLSLIEIIYFLTLRAFCKVRGEKASSKEQLEKNLSALSNEQGSIVASKNAF